MPKLDDHSSAGAVNCVGDRLPTFALLFRVDAWSAKPTPCLVAHEGALRDDEAGRCALNIVIAHKIVRNTVRVRCTHSCERSDHNAIGKRQIAKHERLKEKLVLDCWITGHGIKPLPPVTLIWMELTPHQTSASRSWTLLR